MYESIDVEVHSVFFLTIITIVSIQRSDNGA